MSAGPIWAADAKAAEWRASDRAWEFAAERAFARGGQNDWKAAGELWGRALTLARRRFSPDDPRLGASLANSAAALFFQSGRADAKALEEARRVWARSPGWIDQMRLTRRARGSVHHMRMEAKHRAVYDSIARRRLHDFAAGARATVDCFADGGEVAPNSADGWKAEKPPVFDDARKLLAACLLLAFRVKRVKTELPF